MVTRGAGVSAAAAGTGSAAIANGPIETLDGRLASSSATIGAASRLVFTQLPPHSPTRSVSKIRCGVVVSSGNISLAVYAIGSTPYGDAATIGARVATTGAVACPAGSSTTYINLDVPVTVGPGMWLALSCDNVTATFMRFPAGAVTVAGRMYAMNTSHPAPATPSGIFGTGLAPWIQVET